ncbi:MAG: hypothetical protein QM813_03400 [Verrucomicrobiota bacterium]
MVIGATLAEQHRAPVVASLRKGDVSPGTLIELDFSGINGINGSYIKGTALWFLNCGRLFVSNDGIAITSRNFEEPSPYDIFICVSGLADEVRVEFQEFLQPRGLPLLFAQGQAGQCIGESVLLGQLDAALRFTFEAVVKEKRTTAPALHLQYPEEKVTVTAWNNRLNDLYALRLVRRIRAGRSWEYESLTNKIKWV